MFLSKKREGDIAAEDAFKASFASVLVPKSWAQFDSTSATFRCLARWEVRIICLFSLFCLQVGLKEGWFACYVCLTFSAFFLQAVGQTWNNKSASIWKLHKKSRFLSSSKPHVCSFTLHNCPLATPLLRPVHDDWVHLLLLGSANSYSFGLLFMTLFLLLLLLLLLHSVIQAYD